MDLKCVLEVENTLFTDTLYIEDERENKKWLVLYCEECEPSVVNS